MKRGDLGAGEIIVAVLTSYSADTRLIHGARAAAVTADSLRGIQEWLMKRLGKQRHPLQAFPQRNPCLLTRQLMLE